MAVETADKITEKLQQLQSDFNERMREVLEPARRRLDEINNLRDQLDKEEQELIKILNGGKKGEGSSARRRPAKRVTAIHKKETMGKFIAEGHIKDGTELSKELRTALMDEGLGTNDFRQLNRYLPNGWEAKSNGMRGPTAKTTFHRV